MCLVGLVCPGPIKMKRSRVLSAWFLESTTPGRDGLATILKQDIKVCFPLRQQLVVSKLWQMNGNTGNITAF